MILKVLAWLVGSILALAALGAALFWYFVYSPAPTPPQLSGAWTRNEIESGWHRRVYRVYTPASLASGSPLLIVLHSSSGNADQIRRATGYGFDRLADANGFAVAYPQGFEGNWNACNRAGDYSANTLNIDDVGFIGDMIDEIVQNSGADPDRVFAVGLSRGGHMAFRLALDAPDRFRAVAAVAASLPTQDNFKCDEPDEALPSVMIMNGTDDPLNPFEGGHVRLLGLFDRGTVISSNETAQYFAGLAQASGPQHTERRYGRVSVDHAQWRSDSGAEIQLSAVQGAGHVMPQAHYRNPRILGHTPRDLDGPAEIWAFFERQM